MVDEIEIHRDAIRDLLKEVLTDVAGVSSESFPYIYHYTSVGSFKSILEDGGFWASDVSFLNDSREISYGCRLFLEIVEKRSGDRTRAKAYRDALSAIKSYVSERFSVCSVSFCVESDLLSQWRGYGAGQGISLGVSTSYIKSLNGFEMLSVIYDKKSQESAINRMLDIYADYYVRLQQEGFSKEDLDVFALRSSFAFDKLVAVFKDAAFKEEGEVRAFTARYSHDSAFGVKFREKAGVLIPYYMLPLDTSRDDVMNKVVIGPGQKIDLVSKGIDVFLNVKKIKCKIDVSSVALRG